MKTLKTICIPLLFAVAAVAILFWNLENWMPHQENIFTLLAAPVLPIVCLVQLWRSLRARRSLQAICWGIALIVCWWVFRCRWSMPMCLECNGGVNLDELGWMARYFR